jgi:hypothetical protein
MSSLFIGLSVSSGTRRDKVNDRYRTTIRGAFQRAADWVYDHTAEVLAFLVATVGGLAISIGLTVWTLVARVDTVESKCDPADGELCDSLDHCLINSKVKDDLKECQQWRLICIERSAQNLERIRALENRLNSIKNTP